MAEIAEIYLCDDKDRAVAKAGQFVKLGWETIILGPQAGTRIQQKIGTDMARAIAVDTGAATYMVIARSTG